jgi:hypothetical protein
MSEPLVALEATRAIFAQQLLALVGPDDERARRYLQVPFEH